jgi:hypothetical protein
MAAWKQAVFLYPQNQKKFFACGAFALFRSRNRIEETALVRLILPKTPYSAVAHYPTKILRKHQNATQLTLLFFHAVAN